LLPPELLPPELLPPELLPPELLPPELLSPELLPPELPPPELFALDVVPPEPLRWLLVRAYSSASTLSFLKRSKRLPLWSVAVASCRSTFCVSASGARKLSTCVHAESKENAIADPRRHDAVDIGSPF
jgi:hypothetical protein